MTDARRIPPLLTLMLGAACISTAPILVKWVGHDVASEDRLGPTAIGFWRMLFGAACLFLWLLVRRARLLLGRRALMWSCLTGLLFSLDLYVWHRSILGCGAGMSTILGNTQVFWTAALGRILFGERLSSRFFLAATAALVGVALLIGLAGTDFEFTRTYITGVALGLATGMVYGHFLIALKAAQISTPGTTAGPLALVTFMAWNALFSALFLGLTATFESDAFRPADPATTSKLIALGILPQALGWLSISSSIRRVPAARAGLVLLLQPILAMTWAMLWFGEQLEWIQMGGAAVTLGAIYFGSRKGG